MPRWRTRARGTSARGRQCPAPIRDRAAPLLVDAAHARDGEARAQRGSAPNWASLQRDFWQRAVDPPPDAARTGIGALLDDDLPVNAERGARVYSDAYAASTRAALATNFPSLVRVLGADDWAFLSRAYLRAHPPADTGSSVGRRARRLVRGHDFTADQGVSRTVVAESRCSSRRRLEAQDAPDPEAAIAPAELAAIDPADWEHTRLAFAPDVRVVRATHDVAPVVLAVSRGEVPERPPAVEQAYLVARRGSGVCADPLASDEAALFEALLAGRAFGGSGGGACARSRGRRGRGWPKTRCAPAGARFCTGWLTASTRPVVEQSSPGPGRDAAPRVIRREDRRSTAHWIAEVGVVPGDAELASAGNTRALVLDLGLGARHQEIRAAGPAGGRPLEVLGREHDRDEATVGGGSAPLRPPRRRRFRRRSPQELPCAWGFWA